MFMLSMTLLLFCMVVSDMLFSAWRSGNGAPASSSKVRR